jgi:hypothetical protein
LCFFHCLESFPMMAFILKGLDGDLFTLFHGMSVDLVLWHSSSCSMDLSTMHEYVSLVQGWWSSCISFLSVWVHLRTS